MLLGLIASQLLIAATGALVVSVDDLQTMAHRADVVVAAVVTDRVATRDPDGLGAGRVVTLTELTVLDARAADPATQRLTLSQPVLWLAQLGGRLDGVNLSVPGATRLDIGDRVVLFAKALPNWPGVVIPYVHGAGLFHVLTPALAEHIGDVVTANGAPPTARAVDDLDTLWRQTGLSPNDN